jgi:hypothetical protein
MHPTPASLDDHINARALAQSAERGRLVHVLVPSRRRRRRRRHGASDRRPPEANKEEPADFVVAYTRMTRSIRRNRLLRIRESFLIRNVSGFFPTLDRLSTHQSRQRSKAVISVISVIFEICCISALKLRHPFSQQVS